MYLEKAADLRHRPSLRSRAKRRHCYDCASHVARSWSPTRRPYRAISMTATDSATAIQEFRQGGHIAGIAAPSSVLNGRRSLSM